MTKKLLPIFFSLLLVISTSPALALMSPDGRDNKASGRILVKFKEGTPQSVVDSNLGKHGARFSSRLDKLKVLKVDVARGEEDNTIAALTKDPDVQYAEPDFVARAFTTTNDPSLSQQWGMFKIQAANASGASAWDVTSGDPGVKIAILDTGIDQAHGDLSAKIIANQNFTTSSTVDDFYGHGTHTAGIAAAITNNNNGVAGVGYNSSLMNVKVLDDTGSGYYSWIASGITWATDNGAKVISMSLGGSSGSQTLQDAVNYAVANGVVVVAAAGNNGNSAPSYPAYYSGAIAVAATDSNDGRPSWSSYGSWVDVAAPGVDIYSTFPTHTSTIGGLNYGLLSGTSMATPHVAGLAALVWASGICSTNTCVRAQIENNADPISGTGTYWTYGRINAYRAVGGISPSPTPSPTPSPSPSPSPTPTPAPSPSPSPAKALHASDMSMYYTVSGSYRYVYTKVTVLDQSNNPVRSAKVNLTVTFPAGGKVSTSGYTSSNGTVTFRLRSIQLGTFTSNLTKLSKSGYTYDAAGSVTTKSLLVN